MDFTSVQHTPPQAHLRASTPSTSSTEGLLARRRTQLGSGLVSLWMALSLAGCTSKPAATLGKPYYSFAWEDTSRLWLIRNFEGEKPWSAQVVRNPEKTPFAPEWIIESAPIPLRDRYADTSFVQHFLDTLRTLVPRARARSGTPESFGLQPPRTQIEWTWQSEGSKPVTSRVQLGNPVSAQGSVARFATLSGVDGVYEVEGAALRMLEFATDWTMLRQKQLALWNADDVDLIEPAPGIRYERAGLNWDEVRKMKGKETRNRAPSINLGLNHLMHQRVLNYLDSPSEQELARKQIQSLKPRILTLRTRKNDPQTLELYAVPAQKDREARFLVRNSLRGEGLFEAYPALTELFGHLGVPAK